MVRRSRRRRGSFRRARSFIRKTVSNMGPIEAKRILVNRLSIPAKTSADFDNPLRLVLLTTGETINEELISDGTNIAEAKVYSKLVGMKLRFSIQGLGSSSVLRWILMKEPDGEDLTSTLTDEFFHGSTDTPTNRELRANILSKGIFTGSDRTGAVLMPFVRRSTLKRLGNLRENDRISLVLAHNESSAMNITGMGTLYVRMN